MKFTCPILKELPSSPKTNLINQNPKRKEEKKKKKTVGFLGCNTRNVSEAGLETILELLEVILILLVDLIAMTQQLFEGDGFKHHRFQQVEVAADRGDPSIEALYEGGRSRI